MNKRVLAMATVPMAILAIGSVWLMATDNHTVPPEQRFAPAATEAEARSRAWLMHEMVNGTLQIMHRDFFDADNAHAIPSASLRDVFSELEKSFDVKLSWLTVNADVVNFEHQAKTNFEKAAVRRLAAGEPFAEEASRTTYQFAGPISLKSQCLKCHLKLRSGNEPRISGLVISMPITTKPPAP